jgi:hypothetical protein
MRCWLCPRSYHAGWVLGGGEFGWRGMQEAREVEFELLHRGGVVDWKEDPEEGLPDWCPYPSLPPALL